MSSPLQSSRRQYLAPVLLVGRAFRTREVVNISHVSSDAPPPFRSAISASATCVPRIDRHEGFEAGDWSFPVTRNAQGIVSRGHDPSDRGRYC